VLPDLSPADYEALRDDIAEHGLTYPPVVDEYGTIVDGHQRRRALEELGLDYHAIVLRPGLSDAEKRTEARRLNLLHRQVSHEERRGLIAGQLRDTPDWSDRRIGQKLGVDGKTVGGVRAELEGTAEIPQLEAHEGADGRLRAKRQPVVLVKNRRELKAVLAALPDAAEDLRGNVSDARGVAKAARRVRWHRNAAAEGDIEVGSARLLLGDFMERGGEIPDESIELVYTDPPYEAHFYDRWADLGGLCARVLKPTGLAIFYSGLLCFPYAFDGLRAGGLRYWALGTLVHPGQHSKLNTQKIFCAGKALLFMARHDFTGPSAWIDNIAVSPQPEKTHHDWQQSVKPAQEYIRVHTQPGDTVFDPFVGGGTFGVAAVGLGRNYIGIELDAQVLGRAAERIRAVEQGEPAGAVAGNGEEAAQ
jgi:site-specific DNA-methyltransferase (adenine-specific)